MTQTSEALTKAARESPASFLAVLIPATLLAVAIGGFQYALGLHPCEMCIWQRWPLAAAFVLGVIATPLRRSKAKTCLLTAAALAILTSGAIAFYHAGIEQKWWQGATSCTSIIRSNSSADLLDQIMAAPIIRCDQVPWSIFGLSIAALNAIVSTTSACALFWFTFRKEEGYLR